MAALTSTFRAFRYYNYRLFFCGQSISQIGTWMQRTAVSWLVYSITQSPFMLGLTIFAQQFPSFLLSLVGGIVSDRYNRHRILLFTQTASMIQAILLAVLTLYGHYAIWQVLSLSVLLGIVNAFDVPARQPMIHELVTDKEDMTNALALNSAMVNMARLIGPALSGLVLQRFGAGICFLLNAISFIAVLISLLLMKLPPYKRPEHLKNPTAELAEGFGYLKNNRSLSSVLLLLAVVSLCILPYDTLLPVFAKKVFHGNAATFGYINSFMGLGAIAGTLLLATLRKGTNLKNIALMCTTILGVGLILFSRIRYFPLAMAAAVMSGFGTMAQNTTCITIIQVESSAQMRGRMMSYVALAYFGMLPLGSLLVGTISQHAGVQYTMLGQGILALLVAAVFYNRLKPEPLPEKEVIATAEETEELMSK